MDYFNRTRISSGAHTVCSMEGLCMPRNFKKTLFNSTDNLMENPLILSYANSHRCSAHCHVTIWKLLYPGKEVSKSETVWSVTCQNIYTCPCQLTNVPFSWFFSHGSFFVKCYNVKKNDRIGYTLLQSYNSLSSHIPYHRPYNILFFIHHPLHLTVVGYLALSSPETMNLDIMSLPQSSWEEFPKQSHQRKIPTVSKVFNQLRCLM